jgi:hypothetical protein
LGIKIMMPPEAVSSAAGALITRQVLSEIVRKSVRTPLDEHYFAVMVHKGFADDLGHMTLNDIAKLLSCPSSTVRHLIAEHIVNGSARGGCKFCKDASKELKTLIVEEEGKDHGVEAPFSLFVTLSAISSSKSRRGR